MSKFPVIEVGDPVTADMLNSMIPDITYKSTATSRASTITPTDDPDLVTPVLLANGTYLVEFSIRFACLSTIGIRTAWNNPAGVLSANKEVVGPGSTATDTNADNISGRFGVHGYTTNMFYGGRNVNTNQSRIYESSTIIMGGTAGAIALQWAQVTSSATATIVSAGSYVRVTRTA